jgi:Aldehyde dehydrogenase family
VPEALYGDVVEALAERARSAKVDAGSEEGTQLGPINNRPQYKRVSELAADALAGGAEAVAGGKPMAGDGYFFEPTILANISDGTRIVDEKQFGRRCRSSPTTTSTMRSSGPTPRTSGSPGRCGAPIPSAARRSRPNWSAGPRGSTPTSPWPPTSPSAAPNGAASASRTDRGATTGSPSCKCSIGPRADHAAGRRPVEPSRDPHRAPYLSEVSRLIERTEREWWPAPAGPRALGCPPWLAERLAREAGVPFNPSAGGGCIAHLPGLLVFGSPCHDRVQPGALVVHDTNTGWSYPVPLACHPDVLPHRWRDYTLALEVDLNVAAALDAARISA